MVIHTFYSFITLLLVINGEMNVSLLCTLLIMKDSKQNHSVVSLKAPTVQRRDRDRQIKDNLCHYCLKTFEMAKRKKALINT